MLEHEFEQMIESSTYFRSVFKHGQVFFFFLIDRKFCDVMLCYVVPYNLVSTILLNICDL